MKNIFALLALLLAFALAACLQTAAPPGNPANPYGLPDGLYTEITTPRGVIVGQLFYKKTPMTVANYVGLAEGTLGPHKGTPFYDGNTFFRVVPNFVIQGGSGAPGPDGAGAGYEFPDEIVPGLRHDSPGTIQMANDGPDTNGSQWCMMTSEVNRLNYNHTVFGHVVRGLELLPQIQQGDWMRIKILRLGPDAQAFKADQQSFDALVAKAKHYEGPKASGPDAWFDDPDAILPTDIPRAVDFNRKLGNFQRFTGGRIVARMFAKTPPDAEAGKLDAFMQALAEKTGVGREGALLAYFKDTNQWHVRLAGDARQSFMAGPRKPDGTKDPAQRKTVEAATADYLALIRTETPRLTAIAIKAMPDPTRPLTEGQKIKYQVDAALDNLIFRLEPARLRDDARVTL